MVGTPPTWIWQAADGGYFTNHFDASTIARAEVQAFVKAMATNIKMTHGNPKRPDALAALAYDATNLLLQAIKDAGSDDTTKVRDALVKISFNAVSGDDQIRCQSRPD